MFESLFFPHTIAVLGASSVPGDPGYELVNNLLGGGFKGRIVPVAPNLLEVVGLRCYPNLRDFGELADLALIATPPETLYESIGTALDNGAKAIVIVTAGPTGAGHAERQRELATLAASRGTRILGPGSVGVINTHHAMNASLIPELPKKGGVTVLSQSSAMCAAILDVARGHSLGIAKMAALGNNIDPVEHDLLHELGEDKESTLIAGYLVSISSGDSFIKAAETAAALKPVVMLKVGTTTLGSKAAMEHFGAPVGADMAYGAAFRRAGVVRTENFEQFIDYAIALSMQPLPRDNRVGVVTNGGGAGIIAADAVDRTGLGLALLDEDKGGASPERRNPFVLANAATPEDYAHAISALATDPGVDAILVILVPCMGVLPTQTAEAIVRAAQSGTKPIVTSFIGGDTVAQGKRLLMAAGIPNFAGPTRAIHALSSLCEYALWRRRPPRIITRFPVNRRRVERIINRHLRTNRTEIGELDSKEILEAYGFRIPVGQLSTSAEEAVEIAERIGFPVALKIVAPGISRKSAYGGVRVGLATADEVRDAFDLMVLRLQHRAPHLKLEGVFVERMARSGREVVLGVQRDPQFGPMLMFGLGGIFVETMEDVAFHLAPITEEEAMQMLRSTRSWQMLRTAVEEQNLDLHVIADGLQRLSQLATDFPQIKELDINPFIVAPSPHGAEVVDAGIILGPVGGGV